MEAIRDLSWSVQVMRGTLERFDIEGFQATTVGVSVREEYRGSAYRYRLLLFSPAERNPIYAVNLESDIFGEWILTEQIGKEHRILRRLGGAMIYEDFRLAAVEYALSRLDRLKTIAIVPKTIKATRSGRR